MQSPEPVFHDNPGIKGREEKFILATLRLKDVVRSWRTSLFAHEWLDETGQVKPAKDMPKELQEKRFNVIKSLNSAAPLPRPILGIGITDGIEIGSGRDVVLTLFDMGVEQISAHIPKSHERDFKPYQILLK